MYIYIYITSMFNIRTCHSTLFWHQLCYQMCLETQYTSSQYLVHTQSLTHSRS